MLHHGSVERVENENTTLCFHLIFFWHFVNVFHQKICVFIIFISFFDEASNFRNRIMTNQKLGLVVQNCQGNFIYNTTTYHS